MTVAKDPRIGAVEVALHRGGEVPVGVQLGWSLRSQILAGSVAAGTRLPALRELAEHLGVNANTVRAVYLRLEHEGLVTTRHGSGTFVAEAGLERARLAEVAGRASRAAHDSGLDPREVAAAMYVGATTAPAQAGGEEVGRRRELRLQIATLERALGDLQARHPELWPTAPAATRDPGPRLLSVLELESARERLLGALAVAQEALAARSSGSAPGSAEPRPAPQTTAARPPAVSARSKIAPAGA